MGATKRLFNNQREIELSNNLKLINNENIIINRTEHRDYQKRNY
jgi:hypothetical protein